MRAPFHASEGADLARSSGRVEGTDPLTGIARNPLQRAPVCQPTYYHFVSARVIDDETIRQFWPS
jgi:hypothetical protein